jgi:peptidoglycan/xylan/chitin deacetylase (PgdA/CDA1 family)
MSTTTDPAPLPRDFAGYGEHPPHVEWPDGARMALNLVINWEEGAERNPLDGDREPELEIDSRYIVPPDVRELYLESTFEYGSRVGIWRMLDLFDRLEMTPTVFACGQALERSPEITRAFVERGCDFIGHGYRWISPIGMDRSDEAADIVRCAQAIETTTGYTMRGWFARPPSTEHTRSLVAQLGLLYDSAAINDDLPYYQRVDGRPLLIVPYSLDVNDSKFFKNEFFRADQFATYAIDAFDALYEESGRTPRIMSVGLHPRMIGRPGRFPGLERFLEHVRDHDDVWIAPRDGIARTWSEQFAPDDAWNNGPVG